MNAKSKVKPKCFRIARSTILLLIIVLISISGISHGGVSPIDPNFLPIVPPTPLPGLRQSPTVQSANIIWVSDAYDDNGDGIADDQFWVDLLVLNGHNIDNQNNWRTLNSSKITTLNSADLVIISQSVNSGDYDDGDEPTTWNSIETPMIIMSPYLASRNRWGWIDSNSIIRVGNDSYPNLIAQDPLHLIFLDMNLDTANMLAIFDWSVSGTVPFISTNDVGNGLLLAIPDGNENWTFIAEWAADIEFYPGSGQIPGGKRMLFSAGTYERGEFNLNPEGQQLFINMIEYMLGNLGLDSLYKARDPYPAHKAYITLPLLQWTAGDAAASYNVYYGDDLALVTEGNKSVLVVEGWPHNFYFPGSDFKAGVTYYWRIDIVKADGTVTPGDIWNFTTKAETPALAYPEPVAWWPFDENEGTIAIDAVRWRESQVVGAVWGPGKLGAALGFDGNAYVKTPFVRRPEDGPIGVFCWVRREQEGVIVSQQNGVNWLMTDAAGRLMTELPADVPLSSTDPISNEWNYVGVTWDGYSRSLYINGDVVAQDMQADSKGSPDGLNIGGGARLEANEYWTGQIDEVQVYDNARLVTMTDLDVLKTRQANIMKREYYTGPATLAPVKIDLNFDKALAAVLRYGATEEQAKAFAARLGLQVADFDEHNRIVTFSLPYDTSRPDVARFAGAARQLLSGSPFAEIGLALTPPLADTSILVNDEFVVRFEREMTDDEVEALTGNAVEIVEKNPFRENEYLLRVDPNAGVDALDVANRYHEDPCAVYGVPNLAIVPQFRGYVPNDTFFPEQWHLNDELNNADINAPEAWDISKGDGVVIAVIDSIVDSGHPDLSDNLWENPGEGANKNKKDDDGNGYIDDIHGCDFGYSDDSERAHGTAVAGCIGAQMDNDLGVTGSCPNCKLMLLRCSIWTYDQKKAFDYACAEGADVICCAWGYRHGIPVPQDVNDAIHFAAKYGRPVVDPDPNRGCVIVFAMTNEPNDNSAKTPDISSLEEVIAVSGCTSEGLLSGFGFGADMDLLAPTSGGTRSIVTTDLVGNDGYNPSTAGGSSNDLNNLDYTQFFGGTSAACATAAGVAGLVLSANPNLRRFEVQDILQRTADKIDAENAGYGNNGTGHSNKYGYGRINAYKAVSAALECK